MVVSQKNHKNYNKNLKCEFDYDSFMRPKSCWDSHLRKIPMSYVHSNYIKNYAYHLSNKKWEKGIIFYVLIIKYRLWTNVIYFYVQIEIYRIEKDVTFFLSKWKKKIFEWLSHKIVKA